MFNFVTAFLNSSLSLDHGYEELFMELPTGVKHGRGKKLVAHLQQGLYGLKQAARIWYFTLVNHMKSLGFEVSKYDAGLLFHRRKQVYVTLHIDDCRIMDPSEKDIEWLVQELKG